MTVETQLNPTQPVNQQIYRILRRDIVHCLIAPGTPLSEKEVSVRFNVSRQPVREAFIKLAENGLIQIRPQRGSYVNKISMAQVRNGSFIRQAIECAVARRAASMITESQCYQLEQNLHQQRIAIERKQLDDFFELDDNFHQLLTQIADCQLAWDTIENLKATVDRVRYMSFDHVSPPEMLLRQHLDIFSALQKRDGDAVERAMTQHLQEISESVRQIRQEIDNTDSDYDREKLQERLAKLSGGVAVIKVGAQTEVAMKEQKLRVEDALNAARAAVEEGIVAGGGTAQVNAIPAVEKLISTLHGDEKTGARIIAAALQAPIRQIAENAGVDGSVVYEKIRTSGKVGYGYNAYTEEYVDMIPAGIVDPTKVTRSALENAASIAGCVLTTESLVVDKPDPAADAAAAAAAAPATNESAAQTQTEKEE